MSRDEVNDFLMGGSGKAYEFKAINDSVTGTIIDSKLRQQTDFQTGAPQYWNDGSPKMMLQVSLQTSLQDDQDDAGVRNIYLRGGNFTATRGQGSSSLVAVKDAVKRSGATGIEPGGTLTLTYTGEGQAPTRGMNAPKLYTAEYKPPVYNVSLDELA